MKIIDLKNLTDGERFHSLSGFQLGKNARAHFGLDELDVAEDAVSVIVPDHVFNVAPSFFQGMFAESVRRFHTLDAFLNHYRFDVDAVVMRQVLRGINACLNKRDVIEAA